MAQGRSTNIISMIEWIRTSRLSIKNSLSRGWGAGTGKTLIGVKIAQLLLSLSAAAKWDGGGDEEEEGGRGMEEEPGREVPTDFRV